MKDRLYEHLEERDAYFAGCARLDRRDFLKVSAGRGGRRRHRRGLLPHSFQPVDVANADAPAKAFTLRLHLRLAPLRADAERPLRRARSCARSTT